jgi:hypothetical protein
MARGGVIGLVTAAGILAACASGPASPEIKTIGDGLNTAIEMPNAGHEGMIPLDVLLDRTGYAEVAGLKVSDQLSFQTGAASYELYAFGEAKITTDAELLQQRAEFLEQVAYSKKIEVLTILDEDNETEQIPFIVQPSNITRRYMFFITEDVSYPDNIFSSDIQISELPRALTMEFGDNNVAISIIRSKGEESSFIELCQAAQDVLPVNLATDAVASIAQETVCNSWRRAFSAAEQTLSYREYVESIEVDFGSLPPNPGQRNALHHPIDEGLYLHMLEKLF